MKHALLNAVDVDVDLLREAARERLATVIEKRLRHARTQEQQDAEKCQNRNEQVCDGHQHITPQAALEPAAFDRLTAVGAALNEEQAVALALVDSQWPPAGGA